MPPLKQNTRFLYDLRARTNVRSICTILNHMWLTAFSELTIGDIHGSENNDNAACIHYVLYQPDLLLQESKRVTYKYGCKFEVTKWGILHMQSPCFAILSRGVNHC